MEWLFTDAVERAFTLAQSWTDPLGRDDLQAPALLLGLLAESECRAASILQQRGVDEAAVRARWSALGSSANPPSGPAGARPEAVSPQGSPRRFAPEVRSSVAAVRRRLELSIQPLVLATEHILLGLAAADHEVAVWLRQRGVDPDEIEREIRTLYGLADLAGPADSVEMIDLPEEPLPKEDAEPAEALGAMAPGRPASEPPAGRGEEGRLGLKAEVGVLRVIDASGNRAREGLRVVEDYLRFLLDDRHLTEQVKRLRHDLTAALARIPMAWRLSARETQADVGTVLSTTAEWRREGPSGVLTANFARLQESLRSLEEYSKLLDVDAAARFEQLRYRTYTLQRAVEITGASLDRLAGARLYVLLDGGASLEEFTAKARAVAEAGADVIQLRDKRLDDRPLLQRARALKEIVGQARRANPEAWGSSLPRPLFIMNDRPDLAALAEADGVHIGQEELAVKDARTIVGVRALVGVSTHNLEQARQAVLDGADYLGAGPTFPSRTKQFDRFAGLEYLRGGWGNPAANVRNRWDRRGKRRPGAGHGRRPLGGRQHDYPRERSGPGGAETTGFSAGGGGCSACSSRMTSSICWGVLLSKPTQTARTTPLASSTKVVGTAWKPVGPLILAKARAACRPGSAYVGRSSSSDLR